MTGSLDMANQYIRRQGEYDIPKYRMRILGNRITMNSQFVKQIG